MDNVARVANLAEAGFLTDELVGLGIEARIHQLEDFNALNDRWTSLYLIQVPSENAEEAAAQIQQSSGRRCAATTATINRIQCRSHSQRDGPAFLAAGGTHRADGHRELRNWSAVFGAKRRAPSGVQFAAFDSEPDRPAVCHRAGCRQAAATG